jgi:hypothetical protein
MSREARVFALAARLTEAIVASDAEALAAIYAPDARVWHSSDGVEMTLGELQEVVCAIGQAVEGTTVAVKARWLTADGYVQTQVNSYNLGGGEVAVFDAALVVWVDAEDRVTRVEEYLDGAGLAPLLAAVS